MISMPRPLVVWAAWAALFGTLYVRAFWSPSTLPAAEEVPPTAPPIEELALDPLPLPEAPVEPAPPATPPEAESEPPDLVLPARPAPEEPAPDPASSDESPLPALPASEAASDPRDAPSALPESMVALPSNPAPSAVDPLPTAAESAERQAFVETYLMLPRMAELAALEQDFELVLLAFDGERCFRARYVDGAPRFEPLALNDLLRTHHGPRYLVPSVDLAGRPTPYRAMTEAFARFRGASGDRLQLQVALPAARWRAIEEARSRARDGLQAEGRWWGVLLVHFEGRALRFEVQ